MKALGYVLGLYPSVKDWWFWAMRYGCKPGPMGGLVYDHSSGGMEKIGKQLVPILDKVRTMDVPEFPAVDNQVLIIDLPKGETLDEEYRALLQTLQDEAEEESVEALRIRQMIEHKKLSTLKEMALEYMSEGNSVVIFLQYSRSIDILEEQLGDLFTVYHGRLNFADREANKNNFQSNQKRGILVQIRAGGMGIGFHDIHGGHPRISLLCATGSADLFYQASGRTPRDGAKSKSIVKMVIAAKTPEMGLRKTLEAKCNSLHELTDADLIPSI
jgi:superfamily II DNA or RNA helicase